jgi:hypothetical protein
MTRSEEINRLRNSFLAFVYLLSMLWGIYLVVSPDDSPLDLGFRIMVSIAVVMSCIYDARLAQKAIVLSAQGVMLFTWPVSVPIYLIWSRGVKRGLLLSALHATLLYAVLVAAYSAAVAVLY